MALTGKVYRCVKCGKEYMLDTHPRNIPGALTPLGGFVCTDCRSRKERLKPPPPVSIQITLDEICVKK